MTLAPLAAHTIWAPRYDHDPNPLLPLEFRLLSPLLAGVGGQRVLDVACGTGRWMVWLRERGANVLGVDSCPAMLDQARGKTALAGRCMLGDAGILPVASCAMNVVLCSFACSYFSGPNLAFREMARVLRAGGRVIVSDLHPQGLAAGWKRSFRTAAGLFDIRHSHFTVADLAGAFGDSGVTLEHSIHGYFGEPEREIFQRADKEHLFRSASAFPAVWIGVYRRC